jgi:putative thiamine transport system permease protein
MGDQTVRDNRRMSSLGLFPMVTFAFFLSAIVIGLLSTWAQAFGYMPSLERYHFSLTAWQQLFSYPGFGRSIMATLISGIGATLVVLLITFSLFAFSYHNRFWRILNQALAPLLAIPHAAFAIGFLFLTAPSGWILRLLSPELTGFSVPPDWNVVKDVYGISLMLALALKEVPFLILISLGALGQIDVQGSLAVGRSLGYEKVQVWVKIILPQLYPKIRLALFAVLAYSLSVVDIAQILGPTTPPSLAVQVFRWFNDPDFEYRLLGAAGATLILLLVIGCIGLLYLLELGIKWLCRSWLTNGRRQSRFFFLTAFSNFMIATLVGISIAVILVLLVWSFTWRWQFPDFLPLNWSFRFWGKGFLQMPDPIWNTISTGIAASLLAVVLVIGCLENEIQIQKRGRKANTIKMLWLIYLPLLIPQIAFLFGVQVSLVVLHLDGFWLSLVWSHLLFVLPYVFLSLGPVYRNYDQRITDVALTLCRSSWRAFLGVKLPILLRPILFAIAIGFSVSVAQYLPTLFIGAGRFDTITTEAVSLASGSDRRIVSVYALFQMLTPMMVFLSAILIPRFYFHDRKGMQI